MAGRPVIAFERNNMRKIIIASMAAAAFSLAACSEKTQDAAGETADSMADDAANAGDAMRSEEHTSELQSLMRISYAVFCLKKKKIYTTQKYNYLEHTQHHIQLLKLYK